MAVEDCGSADRDGDADSTSHPIKSAYRDFEQVGDLFDLFALHVGDFLHRLDSIGDVVRLHRGR